jgi:hypothetical protein
MSWPTGKILLPNGKGLIQGGKFVTNAQDCCCGPPPECEYCTSDSDTLNVVLSGITGCTSCSNGNIWTTFNWSLGARTLVRNASNPCLWESVDSAYDYYGFVGRLYWYGLPCTTPNDYYTSNQQKIGMRLYQNSATTWTFAAWLQMRLTNSTKWYPYDPASGPTWVLFEAYRTSANICGGGSANNDHSSSSSCGGARLYSTVNMPASNGVAVMGYGGSMTVSLP